VKILSINVGRPRIVLRDGEPVTTSIFKEPVQGRIPLRTLNLDGDRQADLSVHGGPDKAVYAYPVEHYDFWRNEFPEMELPWGMFGENLTTEGLNETTTNIGDKFRAGTALVRVTQPRMPCYKLGIRFGRTDIIKRFLVSGRSGFYLSVLEEGEVAAGDSIELVEAASESVSVLDITRLYAGDKSDARMLRRAIAAPALPESWREYFQKYLNKLESSGGAANGK
jgi:MOSC domain-containing protein YiiM